MKVTFKNMLHGYTGKADDMIFYMDKRTGKMYARRFFKFKKHPGQPPFRKAQQQIYAINPSQDYKYDLHDYCLSYNELPENKENPIFTWAQMYNKLMWAMQKKMPESVDLKTLTREQIMAQNLPCRSVKAAVEGGLLPVVEGYTRWDNTI